MDKLSARLVDGTTREVQTLEFARTNDDDFSEGAVVLNFTDGTRALARECTQVKGC